ncbi:putative manganese-dependent inorganic diphosphatase [Akkermansiaceae bacterium]|nr:putative manganese-dependent inorganic diphosphatase [Akkermansiaceae bacterium]
MYNSTDMPTYVIGHQNPDTDAICAAIGYADLLQKKGGQDVLPARCGELPTRTAWVLNEAGMESPALLNHVHTTAEMICIKDVVKVSDDATFLTAYHLMLANDVRSIPVLDSDDNFCGLLNYLDLLQLLMPVETDEEAVRITVACPHNVASTLDADISGAVIDPGERELIQLVGASSIESVQDRLTVAAAAGDIKSYAVICGDRPQIHQNAIEHGVCMLIVTGGHLVTDDLITKAKANGVVVLHCKQDTGTVSKLIRCARKVKDALDPDVITVNSSDTLDRIKTQISQNTQSVFPVLNAESGLFMGLITKTCVLDPPKIKLVLVDHNEFSQAVSGIEEANVVEVLDHHRLAGDIVTSQAIRYINEPVGSSSTLVAREYRYAGIDIPKNIALCLIAGMVTDTLNLSSPTTADLDREILPWLCEIAGVDATTFTRQIFESGSLLANNTAHEALNTDRKVFEEGGAKVTISHIEECGLDLFESKHKELLAELDGLVEAEGFDLALVIVTDITSHYSVLLASGNAKIIEALPYERGDDNVFQGPGVVSRKKQVFPAVCDAIRAAF